MSKLRKVGIAYVPVLHRGYLNYFEDLEKEGVDTLYVISDEILEKHDALDYIHRKDRLRAVPADLMLKTLRTLLHIQIELLTSESISGLQKEKVEIITPKEDIGRCIVNEYFKDHSIHFSDVFLRRNNENIGEDKEPEAVSEITLTVFQKEIFKGVFLEAEKSADWWRRVGAALVKDGEVITVAHNEHMPEEQTPNIIGDARSLFKRGVHINYVTTAHAEATVIAEAAKKGVQIEGAELYVTDFPCPYCARIIAKSGIKKVYFLKGYAVLDGDDFFKEEGIEVVKVIL